jgi:hypothetical protein
VGEGARGEVIWKRNHSAAVSQTLILKVVVVHVTTDNYYSAKKQPGGKLLGKEETVVHGFRKVSKTSGIFSIKT